MMSRGIKLIQFVHLHVIDRLLRGEVRSRGRGAVLHVRGRGDFLRGRGDPSFVMYRATTELTNKIIDRIR